MRRSSKSWAELLKIGAATLCVSVIAGCGGNQPAEVDAGRPGDVSAKAQSPAELRAQFAVATSNLESRGYRLDETVKLYNADGLRDVVAFDGLKSDYEFTLAQFDTPENAAGFLQRTNAALKQSGYSLAGRPSTQREEFALFGLNHDALEGIRRGDPAAVAELRMIGGATEGVQ